ncbi:MAG: HEAT repeat domain-containing protein [Gemmatimonadetes bacterium]|nr:HEAT repeat domain-containing protein [Gemmatimonadota bacterium]
MTAGPVRFSFEARPGVCGNGRNISTSRSTSDWEPWCEPGPVRVAVELRNGRAVDLDTYVGGRWRTRRDPVTDLGTVEPADAVAYLLSVTRDGTGSAAEHAVLPIALADAETWPQLLALARDSSRSRAVRRSAVFWLGQAAGEAAVEGLPGLIAGPDEDLEVKKSAIFALSQLRQGGGVEPLIQIARSNRDPRLRKQAIFWLGQSDDPRAIALFEELLTKR